MSIITSKSPLSFKNFSISSNTITIYFQHYHSLDLPKIIHKSLSEINIASLVINFKYATREEQRLVVHLDFNTNNVRSNRLQTMQSKVSRTVNHLVVNKLLSQYSSKEILECWKTIQNSIYCPPHSHFTHTQYSSGQFKHEPIDPGFANVLLYDLCKAESSNTIPTRGEYTEKFCQIARSGHFFNSSENMQFRNELRGRNISGCNASGETPIDIAIRCLNAPFIRHILCSAMLFEMEDEMNRAVINGILRSVENTDVKIHTDEEKSSELYNFLDDESLLNSLNNNQKTDMQAMITRLVGSAIQVYAFLKASLEPGSRAVVGNDGNTDMWCLVNPTQYNGEMREPTVFKCLEIDLHLTESIQALIIDRIFKIILDHDPTQKLRLQKNCINLIKKARNCLNLSKSAEKILKASDNEISGIKEHNQPESDYIPQVRRLNALFGPPFVEAGYDKKWVTALTLQGTTELQLNMLIKTKKDTEWYEKRLIKAGLQNYKFVKSHNQMYRLVIPYPIVFQPGSKTPDSDLS